MKNMHFGYTIGLLNKYEIIDLTNNPVQKINYYPTPARMKIHLI